MATQPQFPTTTISDLPDVILSNIISLITQTRTRNSLSLVSKKYYTLERTTRTSLTLRGNIRDLFLLPSSFVSISTLDVSLLSPWGHPFSLSSSDADLTSHLLSQTFPSLTSLTLYARNQTSLNLLIPHWPNLEHLKLVRWHQRPDDNSPGNELNTILSWCLVLSSLDLSSFYCWTEDVNIALQANLLVSSRLTRLDLLNPSFSEGFKSDEVVMISKCCPNLVVFKCVCMFDTRYIGFVGDDALICLSGNCGKLVVLHLIDSSGMGGVRGEVEEVGFAEVDAGVSVVCLVEFFEKLGGLEEVALDFFGNVRDCGAALEVISRKCLKMRKLKLGRFHGICLPVESKLDGVAVCSGLEELCVGNVGDLTDMGLVAIGRGCCRLRKFEVSGCKEITVRGMGTLASLLHRTLVDVKISCCKKLGAVASLKALRPIRRRIERLYIDCVWDCYEEEEVDDDDDEEASGEFDYGYGGGVGNVRKKCRYSYDLNGNDGEKSWDKLTYLSLWIAVGDLLTPLMSAGLDDCPNLEEIRIKVEGDCRELSKPSKREFGLSSLMNFPNLTKMHLDCGDTIGYAHTAPSGQMDLSLWERFYLFGIGHLVLLKELDYWPPQDRDVNQRSLSLPAAGLLQECFGLRKLIIHGTAHEHFMMFLLRIPELRDVQLREDYYPAPENDMSTEMRADSCSRFEAALNRRQIPD